MLRRETSKQHRTVKKHANAFNRVLHILKYHTSTYAPVHDQLLLPELCKVDEC
jgi:hypothetical protein